MARYPQFRREQAPVRAPGSNADRDGRPGGRWLTDSFCPHALSIVRPQKHLFGQTPHRTLLLPMSGVLASQNCQNENALFVSSVT